MNDEAMIKQLHLKQQEIIRLQSEQLYNKKCINDEYHPVQQQQQQQQQQHMMAFHHHNHYHGDDISHHYVHHIPQQLSAMSNSYDMHMVAPAPTTTSSTTSGTADAGYSQYQYTNQTHLPLNDNSSNCKININNTHSPSQYGFNHESFTNQLSNINDGLRDDNDIISKEIEKHPAQQSPIAPAGSSSSSLCSSASCLTSTGAVVYSDDTIKKAIYAAFQAAMKNGKDKLSAIEVAENAAFVSFVGSVSKEMIKSFIHQLFFSSHSQMENIEMSSSNGVSKLLMDNQNGNYNPVINNPINFPFEDFYGSDNISNSYYHVDKKVLDVQQQHFGNDETILIGNDRYDTRLMSDAILPDENLYSRDKYTNQYGLNDFFSMQNMPFSGSDIIHDAFTTFNTFEQRATPQYESGDHANRFKRERDSIEVMHSLPAPAVVIPSPTKKVIEMKREMKTTGNLEPGPNQVVRKSCESCSKLKIACIKSDTEACFNCIKRGRQCVFAFKKKLGRHRKESQDGSKSQSGSPDHHLPSLPQSSSSPTYSTEKPNKKSKKQ